MQRKKTIKINKRLIIICCIILSFIVVGFGYAQLQTDMNIDGVSIFEGKKGVKITNVKYSDSSNGGVEIDSPTWVSNSMSTNIELPSSDSTISYDITLFNKDKVDFSLKDVVNDSYSNSNISYRIEGFDDEDVISPKTSKIIKIIFYYSGDDTATDRKLNSTISFEFKKKYNIEYKNMSVNNYPVSIIEGNSLAVEFVNDIPEDVSVYVDGQVLKNNLYSYDGGVLNIDNVEGNLTIYSLRSLINAINLRNEAYSEKCPKMSDEHYGYYEIDSDEEEAMFCEGIDSYGVTRYYRGNVDYNYVSFAGMLWRILRINGNGTFRIILDEAISSTSKYNDYPKINVYAGYKYGSTEATSYEESVINDTDSRMKKTLDRWYTSSLTDYKDYIGDAYFVNDRKINDGVVGDYSSFIDGKAHYSYVENEALVDWGEDTALGYGTNVTYYGAWYRLVENVERKRKIANETGSEVENALGYATFMCTQKNDCFSTVESDNGNGALKYPVATVSMDDLIMAGVTYSDISYNTKTFLNSTIKPTSFWTMTPSARQSQNMAACAYIVTGWVGCGGNVDTVRNIRPVINLKDNVMIRSGDGTLNNPYFIQAE